MPDIVFVGEAWGKDEELYKHPFVGASGQELYRMLGRAGFPCHELPYHFVAPTRMIRLWKEFPYPLLNVFNCRPPDPLGKNDVSTFYANAKELPASLLDKELPPRQFGSSKKWVQLSYSGHIHKLHADLAELKPNLIVSLGATAMWALGLKPAIGKARGSITQTPHGKCLPVYHPAAILRNWSERTITIIDLFKARREGSSSALKTRSREIWTEPTIPDLYRWWDEHGSKSSLLAFDIETVRKTQISEIGFASDPEHALHIPFVIDYRQGNRHKYKRWWPDVKTEVEAWKFVKMVCESDIPKIGQNFIQYDAYWMAKELGIAVKNIQHDTMTKAHCWEPELKKNLGFLGSIFLDERSWKSIRTDVGKDND